VIQTTILAFSLSTDAFAASVAKGAKHPLISMRQKVSIAAGFGVLEALAPLVGFLLGKQFEQHIEAYDHWIAFALLSALGVRMIWKSFHAGPTEAGNINPSWSGVVVTALGTSVDATAVGLTLALVSDNIPLTLFAIGIVTFIMTFCGLHLGGKIGERLGQWVELLGGLGLIAIGSNILFKHIG
jgi:putative Mn2+ efflux pump MntP